VLKKLILKINF